MKKNMTIVCAIATAVAAVVLVAVIALMAIKGFGKLKIARYGGDILAVVNAFGPVSA